ncbi:C-C chemokine receptor-like 2 [Lepus europaeus]|uniref:C-C chemokine receptor-like 2 n=1 Tax=Lepus europaeus TaxID=9983 RepID=UPI002B46B81A|nr:C-C chemokine receptor-like 2 [Lepus europaeus]
MENGTAAPEEEYDVLIDGDLESSETPRCEADAASVLSAQLVQLLCSTMFTLGLLENVLFVLILVKYKGLKQPGSTCFLNLALSNLCFSLSLLFWALTAPAEDHATCRAFATLYAMGLYGEACFSALLIVQSYLASSHRPHGPSATRERPRSIVTSVLVWTAVVITVTLPESIFYKLPTDGQRPTCSFSRPHLLPAEDTFWRRFLALRTNVLVLGLPLCVLVFCSVRMRTAPRRRTGGDRLFQLACAVSLLFLLMWAPYNIALFLAAFKDSLSLHGCQHTSHLHASVQVTKLLATAHCCVTPLLWVLLDEPLRNALCRRLHACHCSPRRPSQGSARASPGEDRDLSSHL